VTLPSQTRKDNPVQNPTACRVFHYFRGLHLLLISGAGALVLNLDEQHRQLLRLLGRTYETLYL
jgi:hypothetical protein